MNIVVNIATINNILVTTLGKLLICEVCVSVLIKVSQPSVLISALTEGMEQDHTCQMLLGINRRLKVSGSDFHTGNNGDCVGIFRDAHVC